MNRAMNSEDRQMLKIGVPIALVVFALVVWYFNSVGRIIWV